MMPPKPPASVDVMIEGLAATAVYLAEREELEVDALPYLRAMSTQVGGRSPQVFRGAADAITRMPLPPVESAEETERARPMRQVLGVPDVEGQLAAALTSREWLLKLAEELDEST